MKTKRDTIKLTGTTDAIRWFTPFYDWMMRVVKRNKKKGVHPNSKSSYIRDAVREKLEREEK